MPHSRGVNMNIARKYLLITATLIFSLPAISFADNILVFGTYPSKAQLVSTLTSLGHTVTNQNGLPADLSGYDSIWHVDAFAPLTAGQQSQLTAYLAAGGGVHLTGERPCCEALNDSLQQFVNSVVTSGGIQVGDLGDISGPYAINPSVTGSLASSPNAVSVWIPSASGGMGGLGNLPDPNIFATGNGDVPVGAAWTEADLVSGSGRLTLLMDTNWFSQPGSGDNYAITENIQSFLIASGGPPSDDQAGTARFLVTKLFEDGLDAEVDVSISCNGGLPLEQNSTIQGGDPAGVTFVLTNVPAGGVTCTVTESGGPEGYTPVLNGGDGCTFEDVTTGSRSCEIVNEADDGTYTVNMDWPPSEDGEVIEESALVSIVCDGVITTSGAYQDGNQWILEEVLGDGDELMATIDTSNGEVDCFAEQEELPLGVVSENDCSLISVRPADMVECTFTNTFFFEGIPTLSQYGIALLSILMLGIGFVGMRRIV